MSGVVTAVRGARDATETDRASWLASIKSEAIAFFKGDNNAPWAILAETVIGCVPVLGQIVDARDIVKGLAEVAGAPASPLAWFDLITALIGLVPGGGDAAKRSLRSVKSGAMPVDDLLAMIRKVYKGDPEKLLRVVMDVSKLRKALDDILAHPALAQRLSPEARQGVRQIRANLGKQFDAFKKEVDGWLSRGRKTSADGPAHAKAGAGTPPAKPATRAEGGTREKTPHGDPAATSAPNAATQRTARFKTLAQKVLGVLGEHMADYHCQEVKGWGAAARHDAAMTNPAKLNDASRMVQLWPVVVRGRGIDAVWKTSGQAKPYAIIEAKASFDPTKSLRALLGEAQDKAERGDPSSSPSGGRSGRAGRSGQKGSAGSSTSIRQLNGKVTQMGHGWIQRRLRTITLSDPAAKAMLLAEKDKAYDRNVLFFSIPQGVAHAEALISHAAGRPVESSMHAAHEATREWTDAALDKVVDNRAGLINEGRRRK
jgi:hypothetical protein